MNLQDGSWKKHGQVHTTELKKTESKEAIIMMNYFCAIVERRKHVESSQPAFTC